MNSNVISTLVDKLDMNHILLFFVLTSLAWAKPKVTAMDQNFPKGVIKESQLVLPKKNPKKYVATDKRDEVLSKYYANEIKKMDELEKDLFYKSIINYDFTRLQKKYPFVKQVTVEKMKHEFNF